MLAFPLAGTNLERAKGFNRRVVVEALRRHAPCSRAELARLTHLSPQTISNIIGEFLAADLVRVAGRRPSRGGARGQPQVDLALNADAAISIGLSLEHDRLVAMAMNLDGVVRAEWSARHADPRPAALLPRIAEAVDALRGEVPAQPWGLGLAMPGPFSTAPGTFAGATTLPGWDDMPVAQRVSEVLGLPVLVERDAAAAARAEYLYGRARELRSFFVLHFGRGLGGSAFNEGRLLRGARGNAGEIGLMVVEPGGRAHSGGPDGCLEAYASVHALNTRMIEAGLDAAEPDHPVVREWVREAARYLRPAIAVIETLFDPEAIIIGGRLGQTLTERLIGALEPLPPSIAHRPSRRLARVLSGTTGPEGTALGAAALPFYDWLAPDLQGLRKPGEGQDDTLSFGLLAEAPSGLA
jgi:predicted NBD/HSP70 family sugar kinase